MYSKISSNPLPELLADINFYHLKFAEKSQSLLLLKKSSASKERPPEAICRKRLLQMAFNDLKNRGFLAALAHYEGRGG